MLTPPHLLSLHHPFDATVITDQGTGRSPRESGHVALSPVLIAKLANWRLIGSWSELLEEPPVLPPMF